MTTSDLSRSAFEPAKRYAGVRMQQGRVLLDSDWNEAAEIDAEDERRTLLDLIGPAGTPDNGFRVSHPEVVATSGTIDFAVSAGTYYIGGLRVELGRGERYALQPDWLELAPQAAPAAARYDLVYLDVWQQPVGAVEDEELREVGLGGPDTTTRLRTMARVAVEADVGSDECTVAWRAATRAWRARGEGAWRATGELTTDARLTVGYVTITDDTGDEADCEPSVTAGYLGAENQAIRVQLVDASTFTWGFDNASSLYRVDLAADRATLTLRSSPVDQAHWPLAGDVVEVLPWSAVLPNGERVAEIAGHLTTASASYQPDTGTLTLTDAVPSSLDAWSSRADAGDLGSAWYYLRVWQRGSQRSEPPAIAFTAGTAVPLGQTGLTVTIDGTSPRAGDYWIIAARPESPDRVVPWSLEHRRPPHGFRRFRAPLAVIGWQASGGAVVGSIASDCRVPLSPLTHQRDCVTYTVGDGEHSHGDFTSIQDAINALPRAGGHVRVLPGEYEEYVSIANRRGVLLEGCGARTVIRPPGAAHAACHIVNSHVIEVRDLAFHCPTTVGVEIEERPEHQLLPSVDDVTLAGLIIDARDRSAVVSKGGAGIALLDSVIQVAGLSADLGGHEAGRAPAVFLASDRVRVERNLIATSALLGARRTAFGGIQLAGGTDGAVVRDNRIEGGNGHGIVLGSVAYLPQQEIGNLVKQYAATMRRRRIVHIGDGIEVDKDGCIGWIPIPRPPGDGGTVYVPVSEGSLTDVKIVGNEIAAMGGSGISVARFFDLETEPDCIGVRELLIARNRITHCLHGEVREAPVQLRDRSGYGGVALAGASRATIVENQIEFNGRSHIDPVCGIFILHAETAVIARNRIRENGPRADTDQAPRPGQRGGVVIVLAEMADAVRTAPTDRRAPAVVIDDNEIVAPEGRAVRITALGPVRVSRNYLATLGFATRGTHGTLNTLALAGRIGNNVSLTGSAGALPALVDYLGGAVAAIVDLAGPADRGGRMQLRMASRPNDSKGAVEQGGRYNAVGGTVAFDDNQLTLDLAQGGKDSRETPDTALLVIALDDVSVQQNRSDVRSDGVLVNAYVVGSSVRVAGNRFSEPLYASRTALSGFTVGVMNATVANEGTHCIFATGALVEEQNLALVSAAAPELCRTIGGMKVDPTRVIAAAQREIDYAQQDVGQFFVNWQ